MPWRDGCRNKIKLENRGTKVREKVEVLEAFSRITRFSAVHSTRSAAPISKNTKASKVEFSSTPHLSCSQNYPTSIKAFKMNFEQKELSIRERIAALQKRCTAEGRNSPS